MPRTPYDEIANEYYLDDHRTCRGFDSVSMRLFEQTAIEWPQSGFVLEPGCGKGRVSEYFGIDSARVVRLDSSKKMIETYPGPADSPPPIIHDATELPFADNQFVAIVALLCDPFMSLQFLHEAYRCLRRGGLLVATLPAKEWGEALRKTEDYQDVNSAIFVAHAAEMSKKVVVPSFLYTEEELMQMGSAAGFVDVSVDSVPWGNLEQEVPPRFAKAAAANGVEVSELPVVTLLRGKK